MCQRLARNAPGPKMASPRARFKAGGMTTAGEQDAAAVHYVTMGGVRERIAAALAAAPGRLGRVLDVGTGEGLFALALAATGAAETVLGIDPHQGCIANARRIARHRGVEDFCRFEAMTLDQAGGDFDTVTLFLALPDLLRGAGLDPLLASLAARLAPGGRLVIAGGFPETAADAAEALGFALHAAIGYVLPGRAEVELALARADLKVTEHRVDSTGAEPIGPREMAEFLLRENAYAVARGAAAADVARIWDELRPALIATRGQACLDARIDTLVATRDARTFPGGSPISRGGPDHAGYV